MEALWHAHQSTPVSTLPKNSKNSDYRQRSFAVKSTYR